MSKLAVIFPGIGYTVDKPLLYYSRRIAISFGYKLKLLTYGGFPQNVRGDREKMADCYRIALAQVEEMLAETDLNSYDDVLFIGKSIGTTVAVDLAARSRAAGRIRFILYTPLEDTFAFPFGSAVVFSGTDDPWVGGSESRIAELCVERHIPCFVIPKANHSLETGSPLTDIENLRYVMEETEKFVTAQAVRG
jgi:phosphoglycolate phosphatase